MPNSRFGISAVLLALGAFPALLNASPVQVLQSDAQGVTLRWELPEARNVAGPDGRITIDARLDAHLREPGRPSLPFVSATIALPPGARPVARLAESSPEVVYDGVRVAVNGRSVLRENPNDEGFVPAIEAVEPVRDGLWPVEEVALGDPFNVRRQRLVAVRVYPYRYDELAARLVERRSITVRVDFVGARLTEGVTSQDRHWEPVLRNLVVNFEQARAWFERATPARRIDPEQLSGPATGRAASGRLGAQRVGAPSAEPNAVVAFDESYPEVRLQTDTTGVYGFVFDDLEASGYPAGVPVSEVSVHRHEFVEGANPAYVTIELPIEVDDWNGNGTFDSGDAIHCWVLSWADRSKASYAQRYWGVGEALYATRIRDRPGLRLPSRSGWHGLTLTPLASYPFLQRFERENYYFPTPPDTNFDTFHWNELLQFARPESTTFEVNHLDTSRSVTFSVTWNGRRNLIRSAWAHVRNGRREITSIADSVRWFGLAEITRSATLNGSALTEGPTNVFRTWGKNSDLDLFANCALNRFDVVYWRAFRALGRNLTCNSGSTLGFFEIQGAGFPTNAIRVYDVTDSLNPVRLVIDPARITFDGSRYTVAFQDSSGGERRRYVAYDVPKILPVERMAAVTRRNLAGGAPASYLLVAPEEFLGVVQPLVDLRTSQGLEVRVAPTQSIYDEFNGGRKSSYALKRFFRYAYDNWNAEFVMLLGDGSEDPQRLLGRDPIFFPDGNAGPDWVPAQKIMGPVPANDLREAIPSDTWLVNFYGSVPTDSSSLPSMFVGRIPTYDVTALQAVIQKIVDYEAIDPDAPWRRKALLLADDRYSSTSFFGGGTTTTTYCKKDYEDVFNTLSERVREIIHDEAGLKLMDVEVFDAQYYMAGFRTYFDATYDTCRGVPTQSHARNWADAQAYGHAFVSPLVLARLNAGVLWWNYQGHANQYVIAHENLYVNGTSFDDRNLLTNVDRPFLFSGFSCHPNGFAAAEELEGNKGPSFGEDLVMLSDRGAIASWASSGYEILPSQFATEHINTRFARSLTADPPRDPTLGANGARVVLGEAIAQALLQNFAVESGTEKTVGISYLLLGDPATRFSIGAPQILVTANGDTVTHDQPVRLVTGGDTLRIEAELVSNVQLTTLTFEYQDAFGTRTIPTADYTVTPAFPDTGAGSTGARRFHLVYRTSLASGSYRYILRTTDRNGLPSRFDIVFQLQAQLRAEGAPIRDGDPVSSTANLSLLFLSPIPLTPATDIELRVNGTPQPFAFVPANNDTSSREWLLSWTHLPYAAGTYSLEIRLQGTLVATVTFTVTDAVSFRDLMAFPNPFDNEYGTRFSFMFDSPAPFDLLLRVYTVSGRLIFERTERSLQPGYHQIPWDGLDAEGEELANGVYFFKLLARSSAGSTTETGRLVKLRRPRTEEPEETGAP